MTDPPSYPESGDDTGAQPKRSTPAISWPTVLAIVVAALVVGLVIVLHVLGGGLRGIH